MKQIKNHLNSLGLKAFGVYLAQQNQAEGINSGIFRQVGQLFGGDPDSPVKTTTLGGLITLVVQLLLVVAGSVAVIFLIIGGFRYVTAHGSEEATEAAKKTISSSIIGLVIIILAFTIITIIANILLKGRAGLGIPGA